MAFNFKKPRRRGWGIQYDSIMEGQDKFIMSKPDNADVGLREDCEEDLDLADVGRNTDLYVVNQESTDLINKARMEDALLRFMGQDVLYFQPLSLD